MQGGEDTQAAEPLNLEDTTYPSAVRDILCKANRSWLKNTEVTDLLLNYLAYNLPISRDPPHQPPGGSIFLFDRKSVRFFRKDGHNWRKKADGKTVRETHEKLKVGNAEMLNCYYAHSEREDGPQRRCYWLLESEDDIVLVHYLNVEKEKLQQTTTPMHAGPVRTSARLGEQPRGGSPGSATQGQQQGPRGLVPDTPMGKEVDPAAGGLLPAMSMDSFFAAFGDQDPSGQAGVEPVGLPDDFSESLLPTWDELGGDFSSGLDWRDRGGESLPAHLVNAGGSLRMVERADVGIAGLHSQWSQQQDGPLGLRQLPAEMRQSMRRGPSFRNGQGGGRLNFQDSLYTTKQEQLKMAAEAMQSAAAAMQGMAGMASSLRMQQQQGRGAGPGPGGGPLPPAGVTMPPPHMQSTAQSSPFGAQAASPFQSFAQPEEMAPVGPSGQPSPNPALSWTHDYNGQHQGGHGSPRGQSQQQWGAAFMGGAGLGIGGAHAPPVGARSLSMELPSRRTVGLEAPGLLNGAMDIAPGPSWQAASPKQEVDEDVGGSKAKRSAFGANKALQLEAELSTLDSQVMNHIRQPSGTLPANILGEQVQVFEEHLQKLESMSTQLMSQKSAPAPYSAADLFADGLEPEASVPGMAGVQPGEVATDDSMGYPFIIVDFTPEWDYTVGGAKMIVTCSFVANCNVDISTVRLHVQIDREEVLAKVLRPGVIKLFVPPHDAGIVDLRLTFGDGIARSVSYPFEYRLTPESVRGADNKSSVLLPDRDLQHRLIEMLTGASPANFQQAGTASGTFLGSGAGIRQQSPGAAAETDTAPMDDDGLPEDTTNLDLLTPQQCERWLMVLIERRLRGHVKECVRKDQALLRVSGPSESAKFSSLNRLSETGHALLHLLAGLGYEAAVDMLIADGADPSVKDAWGFTPLHWAAARGKEDMCALLIARDVDAGLLTFQSNLRQHGRLSPADIAAHNGHAGIAAFLAEAQLKQGLAKLRNADLGTSLLSGSESRLTSPLQRKRSRQLAQISEGQSDPLLSLVRPSPSASATSQTSVGNTPGMADTTEDACSALEGDVSSLVTKAQTMANQIQSALAKKAARQALRDERRQRMYTREKETLKRLQDRIMQWEDIRLRSGADVMRQQAHNPLMGRYLQMGERISAVHRSISTALRRSTRAFDANSLRSKQTVEAVGDSGWGSDSELHLSRSESGHGQRSLRHISESRRNGSGGKTKEAAMTDDDIRKLLQGPLDPVIECGRPSIDLQPRRSSSNRACSSQKPVLSRAVSYIEALVLNGAAKEQYQRLREALLKVPDASGSSSFKFARMDVMDGSGESVVDAKMGAPMSSSPRSHFQAQWSSG